MCNASHELTRVIAYGGMDSEIKESGHRIGTAKLSKRGSGPARDASSTTTLLVSPGTKELNLPGVEQPEDEILEKPEQDSRK